MACAHTAKQEPTAVAAFVDCEATSFNGYCTEIGFAQVWRGRPPQTPGCLIEEQEGGGDIFIKSDSRLVRVDDWLDDYLKWDPAAEKITGISRALLLEQGHPAHHVAGWLNDQLGGGRLYSDARLFDANWIDQVFRAAKVKRGFKIVQMERLTRRGDVDRAAFTTLCQSQHERLHGEEKPHRAAADAISWAKIFVGSWRPDRANSFSLSRFLGF